LIQLYNSIDITGDVAFTVGTMEFRAHKRVLALEAKALYELIKAEESSSSPSSSTVTTVTMMMMIMMARVPKVWLRK
jgi:hypothetical protein